MGIVMRLVIKSLKVVLILYFKFSTKFSNKSPWSRENYKFEVFKHAEFKYGKLSVDLIILCSSTKDCWKYKRPCCLSFWHLSFQVKVSPFLVLPFAYQGGFVSWAKPLALILREDIKLTVFQRVILHSTRNVWLVNER